MKLAVVLMLSATGCNVSFVGKRCQESHCPTDIRQSQRWIWGEDALFHCPCQPDQAYHGHKPTCWRPWQAPAEVWRDERCGGPPVHTSPVVVSEVPAGAAAALAEARETGEEPQLAYPLPPEDAPAADGVAPIDEPPAPDEPPAILPPPPPEPQSMHDFRRFGPPGSGTALRFAEQELQQPTMAPMPLPPMSRPPQPTASLTAWRSPVTPTPALAKPAMKPIALPPVETAVRTSLGTGFELAR